MPRAAGDPSFIAWTESVDAALAARLSGETSLSATVTDLSASLHGTALTERAPRPAMTLHTGTMVVQNGGTDSTDNLFAAASGYVETTGNGVGNSVRLSALTLPNMVGKGVWFPFKVVSGYAAINKMLVQAATDTSYAHYYQVDMPGPSTGKARFVSGQWAGIYLPWSAFSITAGSPTPSTLTSLKLTMTDLNGGTGARILVSPSWGVYTDPATVGSITVSCDDTFTAAVDVCRKMAEYGWRPIIFPIVSRLDTGSYMTTAQLRMCHDVFGAEVGGHCMTDAQHASMLGQSAATARAMCDDIRNWQFSLGFNSSAFAFPVGPFDSTVVKAAGEFFNYQRTNDSLQQPSKNYNGPVVSAVALSSTLTLVAAKLLVDAAVANHSNIHFIVHELLPSGTPTGNQWLKSDFDALIVYAAAAGLKNAMPSDLITQVL